MKNKLFLLLILLPFFGISQNVPFSLKCFGYQTFTESDCFGCGLKPGQFSGIIITAGSIKHALHNPVKVTYSGNMVTFTDPYGKTYRNRLANISGYNLGTSLSTFMEGCLKIDIDAGMAGMVDSVNTVVGLQDSLNTKADINHGHVVSDVTDLQDSLNSKQNVLVSGVNIREINGSSLVGSGGIQLLGMLPGGGATGSVLQKVSGDDWDVDWLNATVDSVHTVVGLQDSLNNKQNTLVSGTTLKTINSTSLLGSGDIAISASDATKLAILNNLSDLDNTTTARTNLGLGNVDNTSDASKPVSTATQDSLNLKANLASPTFTGTVSGITKGMVGLGSVDNTSDADKPVSSAQSTAIGLKQDALVSGTNIKTINSSSILGAGDLVISGLAPAGGTTSQVLTKIDNTNYNYSWQAAPSPTILDIATPTNSVTTGYIRKAGTNWLHDFTWGLNGNAVTPLGRNIFLGIGAGNTTNGQFATVNTQASENIGIGYNSLPGLTTGYRNVTIGSAAGTSIGAGYTNVAIGYRALLTNVAGYNNIAIGTDAMLNGSSGTMANNIGLGFEALRSASGSSNIALGAAAGYAITTGGNNIAIGADAMRAITSQSGVIAIGYGAAQSVSQASNIAIGYASMNSGGGAGNVCVGTNTMLFGGTGSNNTAIGNEALRTTSDAAQSVGVGHSALYSQTTALYNTAVGYQALFGLTTGANNTALGHQAGRYITNGSTANSTGSNSIFIGLNTRAAANNESNQIVIGTNAIGNGANSITLGHTDITKTILRSGVGIGTVSPTARLHLGAGSATASTAPLKFDSGTLNTTAEAGAVEFLTDDFYGTITTGAARKKFALTETSGALRVPTTGGAATAGTVTLVDGTATVNTTAVNANSIIMFTRKSTTVIAGAIASYSIVNGTSFTVTTTGGTDDDGELSWFIIQGY